LATRTLETNGSEREEKKQTLQTDCTSFIITVIICYYERRAGISEKKKKSLAAQNQNVENRQYNNVYCVQMQSKYKTRHNWK
jgi:hypothetical protein